MNDIYCRFLIPTVSFQTECNQRVRSPIPCVCLIYRNIRFEPYTYTRGHSCQTIQSVGIGLASDLQYIPFTLVAKQNIQIRYRLTPGLTPPPMGALGHICCQ